MKIIIEKQFEKLGDGYLQSENIEVDIRASDKYIVIELDEEMYFIPKEVFTGINAGGTK